MKEALEELIIVEKEAGAHIQLGILPNWMQTPEANKVIDMIRKINVLKIFDNNKLQYIGTGGHEVRFSYLAMWMAKRGIEFGAEQVIKEVLKYSSSGKFEAHEVMLLSGLYLDTDIQQFEFGEGISLINPMLLPIENIRDAIFKSNNSFIPVPKINSVLFVTYKHDVIHREQGEPVNLNSDHLGEIYRLRSNLEDVRLCISLIGPGSWGPQAVGVGTFVGEEVPDVGYGIGWSIPGYSRTKMNPPMIRIFLEQAKGIFSNFNKLSPEQKKRLRIPLDYLNKFNAENDLILASILLRVALDSLLLEDDSHGEKVFRLSLRAGFLIGGTHDEKIDIRKIIKQAYNLGSSAVHSGKFPKNKDKDALKIINQAAGFARKISIIRIEKPDIDWDKLEINGGLDS